MATTRIGISGWRYDPWRGTFYPKDLPQRAELEYASGHLPVIEINGSFYSLQRPQSYASWYADTPADFVFTVKAPRYITHIRRLRDIEAPLANFLASGVFNLKEKLGPFLWQFPPFFKFDPERFEAFLKLLPHDTEQAAAVARNHDDWMANRAQLQIDAKRPMRHAVEIRHESFMAPAFVDMLRKYEVALVIAETARKWPMTHDITADFVYMRLHGDTELYNGGYSDESLDQWAQRISAWQTGSEPADAKKISPKKPPTDGPRDVFCFFDNADVKLRAPFDAQTLMEKLGIAPRVSASGEPGRAPAAPADKAARRPAVVEVEVAQGDAASRPTAPKRRPAPADSDAPADGDAPLAKRTQRGKARLAKSDTAPRKVPRKKSAGSRARSTPAAAARGTPGKRATVDRAKGTRTAAAKRSAPAKRAAGGKRATPGKRAASRRPVGSRPVRSRKSGASGSPRRAATGSRRSSARSS